METLNRLIHFPGSRGIRRMAAPGAYRLIIACMLALIATLNPVAAGAHPARIAEEQRALASNTATPVPTATPATSRSPSMPTSGLERAVVRAVVDGDTLDVTLKGRTRRVRLIGVDTPETTHPSRPVECFGREAARFLTELVNGQTVLLESDPSQGDRDRYNRLLRFVWLPDGRLVNYEIIARGYGFEYTFSVPYTYQEQFKAAQRAAREAQVGLWAPDACNGERAPATATPAIAAPSPAAAPTAAGNQTLPPSYNRCRTDPNAARAPNAPVAIVGVDKRAETVTLRNVGSEPINLDGWIMCSFKGSQIHQGIGGALAPGETRTFKHTGSASIWNNRETDPGGLYDPQGRLVSYWPDR
ncbi:MAG: thermonuclease family protein [Roseiflexaceae bacterium]|nr:thermonuclease family protein [Roseiflexus sp.]MDW8213253.1 thermonuclease family protein [Roseiflexaceae bacterium]